MLITLKMLFLLSAFLILSTNITVLSVNGFVIDSLTKTTITSRRGNPQEVIDVRGRGGGGAGNDKATLLMMMLRPTKPTMMTMILVSIVALHHHHHHHNVETILILLLMMIEEHWQYYHHCIVIARIMSTRMISLTTMYS